MVEQGVDERADRGAVPDGEAAQRIEVAQRVGGALRGQVVGVGDTPADHLAG